MSNRLCCTDYLTTRPNNPTQNNKLNTQRDLPCPRRRGIERTSALREHRPRGFYRQRQRQPGQQSQPRDNPQPARPTAIIRYAMVMHTRYSMRVPRSPRRTASVCLPALRSFSISRKLLTTRIAVMIKPTGTDIHHAAALTEPTCTKYVPATAATPKKDKNEDIAESVIAERKWSARVGNRRENRRQPDGDHDPAAQKCQIQTKRGGQPQDDPHAALHLRGRQQSRLGDAQRSLPLGRVCAALEIVDIVRHVAPDLQEKRNGQRRQRGQELERAIRPGERAPHHHARGRGRQRPRSDRQPPDLKKRRFFCKHPRSITGRRSNMRLRVPTLGIIGRV